jgi:hypothetical protein
MAESNAPLCSPGANSERDDFTDTGCMASRASLLNACWGIR